MGFNWSLEISSGYEWQLKSCGEFRATQCTHNIFLPLIVWGSPNFFLIMYFLWIQRYFSWFPVLYFLCRFYRQCPRGWPFHSEFPFYHCRLHLQTRGNPFITSFMLDCGWEYCSGYHHKNRSMLCGWDFPAWISLYSYGMTSEGIVQGTGG